MLLRKKGDLGKKEKKNINSIEADFCIFPVFPLFSASEVVERRMKNRFPIRLRQNTRLDRMALLRRYLDSLISPSSSFLSFPPLLLLLHCVCVRETVLPLLGFRFSSSPSSLFCSAFWKLREEERVPEISARQKITSSSSSSSPSFLGFQHIPPPPPPQKNTLSAQKT